jgi:hypothetical protein
MTTSNGQAALRLAGILCLAISPTMAGVYDVAADFSTARNPNGVWQYGYQSELGGTLTLFTNSGNTGGIDFWNYAPFDLGVGHNTNAVATGWCGSCSIPAGYAAVGPGNNGTFAVFRFVAPETDTYQLDMAFLGADFAGPTTSDVNVLHNGTSLFSSFINGYGASSTVTYSGAEALAAGDTIDIAVGWGSNSNYSFDSTALRATISNGGAAVPEPATSALAGCGGLLAVAFAKRRRR